MTLAVFLEGIVIATTTSKQAESRRKQYSQFSLLLLSDLLSVLPTGQIHLDTRDRGAGYQGGLHIQGQISL